METDKFRFVGVLHRTIRRVGTRPHRPGYERRAAGSNVVPGSRGCIGGAVAKRSVTNPMIAGGNHTIIYMTPPYDGLLDKSKFDAPMVEHNQDAFVNCQGP